LEKVGEPLWLSGKVVKKEKINEIERTRVRSPPWATSLKKEFGKSKLKIKMIPASAQGSLYYLKTSPCTLRG
jgi:hypothetical protein